MTNTNQKESIITAKTALMVTVGAGLFALAKTVYKQINKFDLKDKVVVITGGSRGLGLAMARALAAKGARLALCARTASQLENARIELEELGAEVITIRMDVSNQIEVQRMIKAVYEHFGQLDVLINNAGMITVGPENVMEIQDYKKVMDTNF